MTINSTSRKAGPFNGTGAQTAFPFTFKIFVQADLRVVLTDAAGVEADQVLNVAYTVVINADQENTPGGTVTMLAAPAVGAKLTITSMVPITQGQSIPNNSGFYPKVIENAYDRLTIICQQLAEQVGRSVKFALSDTTTGNNFPTSAVRANNLLGFDAAGNMIAVAPAAQSATALQALLGTPAGAAVVNYQGVSLADHLKNSINLVLPNIAALMALNSSNYTRAQVLGYYAPGDGGGGVYFKNAAPTFAPDGGAMVQITDGTYWQLAQAGAISVKQYGAKGDGVTDDTVAIQKFINYLLASSRRGHVPSVPLGYRLTAPIQVVGSLYLSGDGCIPYIAPQSGLSRTRGRGSWFFLDHTGVGFNLNNANETTEVTFDGIGTFRSHPAPAPGWAPTVCDYDFLCAQANCDYTFKNVYLLNPYKGIFGNGRCTYDNVRGQPFMVGIYSNFCADTNHFRGCHFWPYWSDDTSVKAYQLANTKALWMYRVDNAVVIDCFSLWAFAFLQISEGVNGGVSKLRVANCDGDSGTYFLYVDTSVINGATIQLSNCVSQGDPGATSPGSIGIFVAGKNCRINVSNYVASACWLNAIRMDGTPNRLTVANFRADFYNVSNVGFAAVESAAGNYARINGDFDYDGGNGAALVGGAGQFQGHMGSGNATGTTDASGLLVVTHGLKLTPTRILAQLTGPDAEIHIRISAITSTTFTVKCYRANAPYVSASVQFTWDAFDINR